MTVQGQNTGISRTGTLCEQLCLCDKYVVYLLYAIKKNRKPKKAISKKISDEQNFAVSCVFRM